jgi:PPM family protein phosphatase
MVRPGRNIRLRSSARSDRGRVRQNNEDSVHLWAEDHNILAVVADGMGGAVAGEEASRIAVQTVQDKFITKQHRSPDTYADYDPDDLADLLFEAVREANSNIYQRAMIKPELKGMGTTITMAFARENSVVLAHVGDSRAYYVDGSVGEIEQLTDDHTFVNALLKAGHIDEAEAKNHPMSNVLYRALGQSEDLDIDVLHGITMHVGDRMVLCSDGLTLHVSEEEIGDVAMTTEDPHEISQELVNLALSRGGKDNVSVIVIIAEPDDQHATHESATEEISIDEDDGATVPMNPDFLNVARYDTNKPEARHCQSTPATHGEGHDTAEPFQ